MFNTIRWLHRKLYMQKHLGIAEQVRLVFFNVRHFSRLELLGKIKSQPKPATMATSTIPTQGIRFLDYDCIGFDLDNTICRYKIGSMVKLEYETMAKFLVEKKGYAPNHLMLPMEDNLDFMLKGLMLDLENGNILRITSDGHIVHGSHGTTELTKQDLVKYYGAECRWKVTDAFCQDPLHTWNGPYSEKMRTLLDYFDMPAGLIFARVVDTLDEQNGGPLKSYTIWPDVVASLQDMFDKSHFQLNKGGYFNEMKANPDNYIHECSANLVDWFRALRQDNKLLFLITGSNIDFASHTASNSLGPNWKELFDIIVCFAKKPGFFTSERNFIAVDDFQEVGPIQPDNLEVGGIYTFGNWNGLHEFLRKHSGRKDPKIVYIGDNLVQDIYTPAVHANCDTVVICEELEAEGVFGHKEGHDDKTFLVSSKWGSYFKHKYEEKNTIWRDIILKHSKACIPSLEYVASKPIDQEYFSIHVD